MNGRPVAAFDPEGLVFSAGVDSEMIKLYDLRSFDKVCSYLKLKTLLYCMSEFCTKITCHFLSGT